MSIRGIDFTGLAIIGGVIVVSYLTYQAYQGLSGAADSVVKGAKKVGKTASEIAGSFVPAPGERQRVDDHLPLVLAGSDINLVDYTAEFPSEESMLAWAKQQGTDVYKPWANDTGTRTASGMDMIYF